MKTRKVPMRMCLGCQQMRPKKELLRIVRTPEGIVELDPTGKRNGRGAYICPNSSCFQSAVKEHRFRKAFGEDIGPEVFAHLEGKISS
ncbi:MAG: YlxR family protein [Bacillota bacterium]|nr:YlxR family protein [Bacillota bacterium]MDP4160162.1 YlxR family protein [Bacillota bacterium]